MSKEKKMFHGILIRKILFFLKILLIKSAIVIEKLYYYRQRTNEFILVIVQNGKLDQRCNKWENKNVLYFSLPQNQSSCL